MTDTDLLEGLPIGKVVKSRGRTLTPGECSILTDLTWTIGPVHVDHVYSAGTMFGSVVLAAPVIIPIVSGLWTQSDHSQLLKESGFRIVSALGVEAKYRHPLRFGDTIHVESRIAEARPSQSRPGMGVMTMQDEAINQDGNVVIEMRRTQLFARIDPANARMAGGG